MNRRFSTAMVLVVASSAVASSGPAAADSRGSGTQPAAVLADFDGRAPAADDAAGRFRYASALADAGRSDEALAAFEALVKDFPHLPEPYNNLAALHARQGDFERAKDVLEQAIRTHRSYATVYENLSTVYVEMARSSYVKALRVKDTPPPPRLQMIAALEQAPVQLAMAHAPKSPVQADAAAPAASVASMEPAANPAESAVESGAAAIAALEGWAQAWSAQDVDGYLAAYDETFDPGDGLSRAVWAEQRRERLRRPEWIKIELADFDVSPGQPASVTVEAAQRYSSNTYGDRTLKRFELVERGGRWLIRSEQTLRALP